MPTGRFVPRSRHPGPPTSPEHLLRHRRVTVVTTALAGSLMASVAMGAMPTTMPGAAVSAAPAAPSAGAPARKTTAGNPAFAIPAVLPRRTTEASAYSAWDEGNFCPGLPQVRKMDLTVGSDLVPCGAYVRICLISGTRCVVARRTDWGPGLTSKRRLDMNFGVVRALGYRSLYHWGARQVRWEPVSPPARAVAATRPR